MAVAVFTLLFFGFAFAQNGPDDANCLPGTWLPEGADWTHCSEPGAPYDGSKVPILLPSTARSTPRPSSTSTNTVRL